MAPAKNAGVAWRITCDNDLVVTIAVTDKCILLLSTEPSHAAPWRLGYYQNMEEAHKRAVEMTNSYERLRNGTVEAAVPFTLPESEWAESLRTGSVEGGVASTILLALDETRFES